MTNTFLAANSTGGFYSLFGDLTSKTDHKIFLIKGGPGTGKSTLMKKVAQSAAKRGITIEQMHCSSDPDSLDGVWLKESKTILLDATAPHCLDPRYPGVVEQILPLGEYWNPQKLAPHKAEIIALTQSISGIFESIYRMLRAVGQVQQITFRTMDAAFQREKAAAALSKFFRRQAILPLQKKGKVERRFISALSHRGQILYEDIVSPCTQVLVIEESYECSYFLTEIADKMLADMGYDRLCLLSPLYPERIDHIIVPECSLAIITQNHLLKWQSALPIIKTLPFKAFLRPEIIGENKNKLAFAKKLSKSIYDEVAEHLASEKALHDELEQYYIEAMDFDALNEKGDALIRQIC